MVREDRVLPCWLYEFAGRCGALVRRSSFGSEREYLEGGKKQEILVLQPFFSSRSSSLLYMMNRLRNELGGLLLYKEDGDLS